LPGEPSVASYAKRLSTPITRTTAMMISFLEVFISSYFFRKI